jgi:hypothetical protein
MSGDLGGHSNRPLRPIHSFWRTWRQFLTSPGNEVILRSAESKIDVFKVAFLRRNVSAHLLTADHSSAFASSPRGFRTQNSVSAYRIQEVYSRISLVMFNNNCMRIALRPVHLVLSVSLSIQVEPFLIVEHDF